MAADEEEELTFDDLDDDTEVVSSEETGEESSEDPSWGPVIVVNNTAYAVSLFWQPLQDTNDPYPEVKETVENVMEGADLFCLRSGTSPQYGIGNSMEGHKAGMPSAAAIIAEKFQDRPSSVAVFEVDEGWWFIAVRNDLILSEEDVLYLKEEDAKRAFFAMMAVPDWGRKIAPASWDIEGTEEVDLWDILKGSGSSKLMRINKTSQKTKLIAIGAGLLVLLVAIKLILGLFTPQKKAPVRPLTSFLPVVEEEEEEKKTEEVKVVYPWENLVVTQDLLNRCYAAVIRAKNIMIPGWEVGEMTCNTSGLSTSWRMKWGDLGWAKRALSEQEIPGLDFMLDAAGSTAVVSFPIGNVATHSQSPKMMIYEMREELTHIFQSINMSIMMSDVKPSREKKVDANGIQDETVEIRVYPKLEFSFSSDLPIENWGQLFDKFPALEILQLNYSPTNNIWTYKGQIYEPVI